MVQSGEQTRAVDKRSAILQAATRLMVTEGLKKVTHRHVAAVAGVPVGSIGYYYSSRERLIEVCLAEIQSQRVSLLARGAAAVSGDTTAEELADLFVDSLTLRNPADLGGYVLLSIDAAREEHDSAASGASATAQTRVAELVELGDELLAAAQRPGVNARHLLEVVIGAVIVSSHLGEDPRAAARAALVDALGAHA